MAGQTTDLQKSYLFTGEDGITLYTGVTRGERESTCVIPSGSNAYPLGVVTNDEVLKPDAKLGRQVAVQISGIANIKCSTDVAYGDLVILDVGGAIRPVPMASGSYNILGVAEKAGSNGDVVPVTIDRMVVSVDAEQGPVDIPSTDATLASIAVNGTPLADFDPSTVSYSMELPNGSAAPTVVAVANDEGASVVVNGIGTAEGTVTIVVTAEDGVTEKTYTIVFTEEAAVGPSTDATLKSITVDGTPLADFNPSVVTYAVELPNGTVDIPVVAAVTNDDNAVLVITQSSAVEGDAVIVVTAEDETTKKTYTITFTVAN